MVGETLRVIRVLGSVVSDKIMGQFVAQGDPPVGHCFHQTFRRSFQAAAVQLLEVAQVAEDAAVAVERYRGALLVGEDVEG